MAPATSFAQAAEPEKSTAAAPVPVAASRPALDVRADSPEAQSLAMDEGPSLLGTLLRMVFGLAFIIVLIFFTLNYGARKLFNLGPVDGSLVRVLERVPLEPKKSVYVVQVGDEYLLLGVGEREISLISKLDPVQTAAAIARRKEVAPGKPFWERLKIPAVAGAAKGPGSKSDA